MGSLFLPQVLDSGLQLVILVVTKGSFCILS